MRKQNGGRKKQKKGVSRRNFIKGATAGTATAASIVRVKAEGGQSSLHAANNFDPAAQEEKRAVPSVNRQAILFAIGDTLIPSAPGDPGYRDLEWYGITREVNRLLEELSDDDLSAFNQGSVGPLQKKFTELSENRRADYFNLILKEGGFQDAALQGKLRGVYDQAREAVFTVYYQNFPQNSWPRDANRMPLLRPGDERQITNPNTPDIFTGWDLAGYAGPLTWEEEERRRNYFKKIRWQE
ncbi:MAG TPA: twin-arginine translocation signal domain-containing protein [Blastocatellia bacterium]|nr:twin-arginine translocation signal domain-containing protein [Blastocatellia bacterium]